MIETQNFKLSPHIAACIPLVEEGDGGGMREEYGRERAVCVVLI